MLSSQDAAVLQSRMLGSKTTMLLQPHKDHRDLSHQSFGLKNVGATYQRAIQMCLDQQIGRNVEAYIDDVVIKSKTVNNLIADLEETFANLKRYRWKLNPSKCIFGVPSDIL